MRRPPRIRHVASATVVVAFLLAAAPLFAVDFTGHWTGTGVRQAGCPGGGTAPDPVTFSLDLQQSGSSVTGGGTVLAVEEGSPCINPVVPFAVVVSGQVSGSTMTGTIVAQDQSGSISITAALTATDTMQLSFLEGEGQNVRTRSITLTRSATSNVDVNGTWSGTYTETAIIPGCSPITTSGTATFTIVQNGSAVTATATATNHFNGITNCTATYATINAQGTGTVSGSTVALTFEGTPFTAAVSGNTMTGTFTEGGGPAGFAQGTFVVTRGGGAPPPPVNASDSWTGTYTGVRHKPGCPDAQTSGLIALTLTQAGSFVSGILYFANTTGYDGCTPTQKNGNFSTPISGVISGNSLTLARNDDFVGQLVVSATINGLSMSGTYSQTDTQPDSHQSESGTLSFVRGSTPPAPTCTPTIGAPSIAQSKLNYDVSWTTVSDTTSSYGIDEATSRDFSGATSKTVSGTTATFSHDVNSNTTYFYRVHATSCSGSPGPFSATVLTTVQAPPSKSVVTNDVVLSHGSTAPYSFDLFIPAPAGKKAIPLDSTFTTSSDQPFISVTPPSGTIPSTGATVTVTVNPTGLPPGASTGTVTVTPSSGAPIVDPLSVSLVTPVTLGGKSAPPSNTLIIPVVGHAVSGAGVFQSDARLTNAGLLPLLYQLTFTPTRSDGSVDGRVTQVAVGTGQTIALNDVAKDFFGFGASGQPGDLGIGTLEIRPNNAAALLNYAASRTFVTGSNGTYGQFIAAIPFSKFATKGTVLSLQQVAESAKFRTNLGLVEGSGAAATGRIRVLDDDGNVLSEQPYSLQPAEHQQLNQFVRNNAGISNLDDGRLEITVDSDAGAVTAYASVLDNITADPLEVTPAVASKIKATRYSVPGMAELVTPFSNFHSDMRIYNGGSSAAVVTPTFFPQGGSPVTGNAFTIAAGHVKVVDNALPTLFPGVSGGGSVLLTTTSDSSLVATGRTYSFDSHNGTFGQFIPGVSPADGIAANETPLQLLQVEQSSHFRTNVGVTELTGNSADIRITIIPPDSRVSAIVTYTMQPNEFQQFNRIIESMYGNGVQMYNARIVIEVTGGSGRVAAYASVIDNSSLDPTYVPAQ